MMSISPSYLLYFLPLLISISVVFGCTRHEDTGLIVRHAVATARWIVTFMFALFAVLFVLNFWV